MGKEMRDLIRGTVKDHRLVKTIFNINLKNSQETTISITISQCTLAPS